MTGYMEIPPVTTCIRISFSSENFGVPRKNLQYPFCVVKGDLTGAFTGDLKERPGSQQAMCYNDSFLLKDLC